MEKKSYIEIKVPFTYQTDCFDRLRHRLEGLPIHWQPDYYHITMAFMDETHRVEDIKQIICKYFAHVPPITITLRNFGITFLVPYNKDFGRITRFLGNDLATVLFAAFCYELRSNNSL